MGARDRLLLWPGFYIRCEEAIDVQEGLSRPGRNVVSACTCVWSSLSLLSSGYAVDLI